MRHIIIRDREARPKWTACGYSKEWIGRQRPSSFANYSAGKPPTCPLCLAYQKRTGDGPESLKAMFRV